MAEIVISPTLVQEWEGKQKDALARAEAANRDAAMWGQKVQAARLLLSSADIEVPSVANGARQVTVGESDDNMVGAIEAIANALKVPISRKEMKDRLRDMGFPDERLANYFYTAVNRLALKGKITVDDNKKIGPGLV